jgi:hypothetical protein
MGTDFLGGGQCRNEPTLFVNLGEEYEMYLCCIRVTYFGDLRYKQSLYGDSEGISDSISTKSHRVPLVSFSLRPEDIGLITCGLVQNGGHE